MSWQDGFSSDDEADAPAAALAVRPLPLANPTLAHPTHPTQDGGDDDDDDGDAGHQSHKRAGAPPSRDQSLTNVFLGALASVNSGSHANTFLEVRTPAAVRRALPATRRRPYLILALGSGTRIARGGAPPQGSGLASQVRWPADHARWCRKPDRRWLIALAARVDTS